MTRRAAIALVSLAALALALALAATAAAARGHRADAADPLATEPLRPPPPAPPPPAQRDLCVAGAGAAASALAAPGAVPDDLPVLARRAFATERLAERASTGPAFPQRMGLAVSTTPAPTCVSTQPAP